jgi:hypothetical protein
LIIQVGKGTRNATRLAKNNTTELVEDVSAVRGNATGLFLQARDLSNHSRVARELREDLRRGKVRQDRTGRVKAREIVGKKTEREVGDLREVAREEGGVAVVRTVSRQEEEDRILSSNILNFHLRQAIPFLILFPTRSILSNQLPPHTTLSQFRHCNLFLLRYLFLLYRINLTPI